MSTSVGSIHYDLSLDKSRFDKGAAETHTQLGSLSSKAMHVAKNIAVAFAAMTVAATGFAIKSAADFEQTRIGLENVLGSADKARGILKKVSDFAATTPFEFPELAKSTRMLAAFGFSADDAFKGMQTLGDVAAAVGAPIEDLSYLYGTLRAQGRAFTVDIKQFATRGIPIYKYLAKVLGVSQTEVSKLVEEGKVGFPEVEKAFKKMTAEGGQFHGAMEAQSKSLSGMFSTLKDNIGFAARELIGINSQGDIREGSIFDFLRRSIGDLNKELAKINWADVADRVMKFAGQVWRSLSELARVVGDYLGPKLQTLWQTITTRLVPALMHFWREVLQPLLPVVGTALVLAVGLAVDALTLFLNIMTPLIHFLSDNQYILWGVVGAFAAFKAVLAIRGAVAAFTAGIAVMRGAAGLTGLLTHLGFARAAVALPMIMPAIAVGAAIAALQMVIDKHFETQKVIESTNKKIRGNRAEGEKTDRAIKRLFEEGKITQEKYRQYLKGTSAIASREAAFLKNQYSGAIGQINLWLDTLMGSDAAKQYNEMKSRTPTGGWAMGGYTGQGSKYDIAGIVHRGEYVIPREYVDQGSGLPKAMPQGGGGTTINGNITISSQQDADYFLSRLTRSQTLASMGAAGGTA